MNWTAENHKTLVDLAAQGLSASQIGAVMGVTRNSVIGKMHREKVPRPLSVARPKTERRRRGNGGGTVVSLRSRKTAPWKPTPKPEPELVPFVPRNVLLFELKDDFSECRWFDGPPSHDSLYCGLRTIEGTSYCPIHLPRVMRA